MTWPRTFTHMPPAATAVAASNHPMVPGNPADLYSPAASVPPTTRRDGELAGYRVFKVVRPADREARHAAGRPKETRVYASTRPVARFPGTFTVVMGDGREPEPTEWMTLDSIAAWLCGLVQPVRDHLLEDGWLVEDGEYSYPLGQVIEPAGIAMGGMVRRRESA